MIALHLICRVMQLLNFFQWSIAKTQMILRYRCCISLFKPLWGLTWPYGLRNSRSHEKMDAQRPQPPSTRTWPNNAEMKGGRTWILLVEVSCRGFLAHSVSPSNPIDIIHLPVTVTASSDLYEHLSLSVICFHQSASSSSSETHRLTPHLHTLLIPPSRVTATLATYKVEISSSFGSGIALLCADVLVNSSSLTRL